jgi:protein-S-isoprenylcysteine O-methyltransferase Ste14
MSSLALRVPPVAVALFIAGLMWVASRLVPGVSFGIPFAAGAAIALCGAGIATALAGVAAFRRAHTTVDPTDPAKSSAVVTSGIYRYTRNPMYLGFFLVLTGWAVYLSNLATFPGPLLFVVYMNRFQIGPEERVLGTRFGAAFQAYLRSVRRWI